MMSGNLFSSPVKSYTIRKDANQLQAKLSSSKYDDIFRLYKFELPIKIDRRHVCIDGGYFGKLTETDSVIKCTQE